MRMNRQKNNAINRNNEEVEEVQTFIYLGATTDKAGRMESRCKEKITISRECLFTPEQPAETSSVNTVLRQNSDFWTQKASVFL